MSRKTRFLYPVLTLIFSIIALVTSLFLYIYWYLKASKEFEAVVRRFNLEPEQVFYPQNWLVILVLSVLVGMILLGIFTIFVYNQKTYHLYRLQNNFINNFTHELKTPVTSLRLYLETFRKHELPREDRIRYISFMIQDVDRLTDNINSILNLARMESKRYAGDFTSADLVRKVSDFVHENRHLFGKAKIRIHPPPEGTVTARIQESLFDMLLMNLLTNAVKYCMADPPEMDISFVPGRRTIEIQLKDNGIGLEKGETRKIFRKFYQVGRSDNMSAKGSGLGLYVVDNIARFHKGKVLARSEGPGKGSTFVLTLPRG